MIVNAIHITEETIAEPIISRILRGQPGLLNMPDHMTIGGCFWAVVLSDNEHLGIDPLPNPYSGRDPLRPVTFRLRLDLGNPLRLSFLDMARIHAEIILGLAGQVPGLTSLSGVIAHAPPLTPLVGNRHDLVNAARARHRTPAYLQTCVPDIVDWLTRPDSNYNNCPYDANVFGLTNAQHRAIFGSQGINATQAQLWEEVGRRIGAQFGTGLIDLPRGCYLSRQGGGTLALIRNAQVQHRVKIVFNHHARW